jgi:MFS family permease
VTVVGRLPWLLFALPAGALADRLDRRRTMTLVDLGRAVLLAGLAATIVTDLEGLWILYVVAFALGVGETLFDTAAQSILPAVVVDKQLLSKANGRLTAVELTANQFLGPTIGALIASATLVGALAISSLAYALASVALMALVGQFRAVRSGPPTPLRGDVAEGVRYLARHPLLRALAVCVGVSNLASTAMIAILPLYVIAPGPVGLSKFGYGLLMTTIAGGTVIGSILVPHIERSLGRRRTLLLAAASFPVFSLAPALTDSIGWLVVGFLVGAGLSIGWNIITVSLRQALVPDHLLGRVNAGYRLVAWGTMPVGAALGGFTASQFGLTATFWLATAISALCLPIVFVVATPARLRSDADDDVQHGVGEQPGLLDVDVVPGVRERDHGDAQRR